MADDVKRNVPDEEGQVDVLTLTDDEGVEHEFEVLGTYEENGKVYYALIPYDDEEADEFYVFEYSEDEEGAILSEVEDDEELDRISDIFEDEFSKIDYDEQ